MKKILLEQVKPVDTITLGQVDRSKAIFAKHNGQLVGMLLASDTNYFIQKGFSTTARLIGPNKLHEAIREFESCGYEFFQEA